MRTKILIMGVISLLMLSSILSAEEKEQINFWQKLFPDRLERVYIIMKDGTIFKHTSHYEDKIYMSMESLQRTLKKKDCTIKDIAIIIHNHLKNSKFSSIDHKQYMRLKKHGFNGSFLLYSHMTSKTYDIEDKGKSK
ncbi:hypothetical protein ES705_05334 [subsurface metagenome]